MRRFDGKIAVVTGAAQGIGKACARRLSSEGAKVMIADRSDEAAKVVAQTIRANGGEAETHTADLSSHEGAMALMSDTQQIYGRIDVAVFNVGGTIWAQPFAEYLPLQIQKEIDRSLWPTLWCCHAAVPIMLRQGSGAIVNIGSVATRGVYRLPYAAAKGAVHSITSALALEIAASGVRVNCVAPGGTEINDRVVARNTPDLTDKEKGYLRSVLEQTLRDTPMDRFGSVEEQAAAVAFLASDEASYITGQTLFVAGGGTG